MEDTNIALALDEANEKKIDQKKTVSVHKEKTERLKGRLSVQKKCSEVEKKANAPKELKERYEVILKLKGENQNVQDQLKWKNKRFRHLEEAHDNFVYSSRQVRTNVRWRKSSFGFSIQNFR